MWPLFTLMVATARTNNWFFESLRAKALSKKTAWPLKMGPIGCPETSVWTTVGCVKSQKSADIIYVAVDAWNHPQLRYRHGPAPESPYCWELPESRLLFPTFSVWPRPRVSAIIWIVRRMTLYVLSRRRLITFTDYVNFLRRSRWQAYLWPKWRQKYGNCLEVYDRVSIGN
jgi:hypothetical protein